MKSAVLFLLVYACAFPVWAADYYIDQAQGNDAGAGTLASPWKTITKANQTLSAGDTVHIKAGTYSDTLAPSRSGTSSTQRITYRNYQNDVVTVSGSPTWGLYLNGRSYITVQGLNFTNQDRFLYITNGSHHNIISYCNFDNARLVNGRTAAWAGSMIAGSSQHNWLHHCRFSKYGYYTSDDIGTVMDIGEEENSADMTRYNLIEDSQFFHGGHHVMGVFGMYNVIRNNYFHNEPWSLGSAAADRGAVLYGDRNLYFSGYSQNGGRTLFERNRVGYSSDPPDNVGSSGMSINSSNNIVRFNTYVHNMSAGLSMSLTSSYIQSILNNKIYQNTFFNNGHNPYDPTDHMSAGIGFAIYSGTLVIANNAPKNNILYQHRIPYGEYNINTPDRTGLIALQIFQNNWNGDAQGDPGFVNASTVAGDPMNATLPDLHLQDSSPCKNAGSYLTTIQSAGGTGTSFVVADAGYFMDGWGISGVKGDEIQLFGTTQRARISAVNYATNMITVDQTLSWTQNQGVSLSYEGSAPDPGAYEIGAIEGEGPGISTTTTTTILPGNCPVKKALNIEKGGLLSIYYKFRDNCLAKTVEGKSLTRLYYRNEAEISQILSAQDELMMEARRLLLGGSLNLFWGMMRNKALHISAAQQERLAAFLNALKISASEEFQADIELLLVRLEDGSLEKVLSPLCSDL